MKGQTSPQTMRSSDSQQWWFIKPDGSSN